MKDKFNAGEYTSSCIPLHIIDSPETEGDVDLLSSDVRDPHAIAGLLKTFLRELPSSLLTRELHMRFLAVMGAWSSITMPRAFDKYGY